MAHQISEIMTPKPDCCTPDDGIVEVARIMESRDVGIVPVVESQETRRAVGVITDRDIILRVVAPGRDPNQIISVREVMSTELVCCAPDEDVLVVEARMKEHQVRRVLVCDKDGCVVGIVATADLARKSDEAKLGDTVRAISEP
jgi:CBS domain-containing protein